MKLRHIKMKEFLNKHGYQSVANSTYKRRWDFIKYETLLLCDISFYQRIDKLNINVRQPPTEERLPRGQWRPGCRRMIARGRYRHY